MYENWFLALEANVQNLQNDCHRLGKKTKNGARLLQYIYSNRIILEQVPCTLVNFDLWPPNIFVDVIKGESGELTQTRLTWIDPDRCFWGDRIADFVCLEFMKPTLSEKKRTLEYYNMVAEEPVFPGKSENIRFAIMLGYLGLIMEVEKYARYSLFNFGYWRNLMVSKHIFRICRRYLK